MPIEFKAVLTMLTADGGVGIHQRKSNEESCKKACLWNRRPKKMPKTIVVNRGAMKISKRIACMAGFAIDPSGLSNESNHHYEPRTHRRDSPTPPVKPTSVLPRGALRTARIAAIGSRTGSIHSGAPAIRSDGAAHH
jgi:hypothetical protein